MKFRLFISSVQFEFAEVRQKLARYIRQDALLGKFFEPFLFEETPACNLSASAVYLDEVRNCDIYIALLGRTFGNEVGPGVSAVKCLHYWGTRVERPIPSYKTYEGGLVGMIEAALEFVMSRIDRTILEPDARGVAPAKDEMPRLAVREAIVNAVCHRDYESTGSVQVMLFKDRLEIINSGSLPRGWTAANLVATHDSRPRNTTLAKALDWAGFVEQSGHGTQFIVEQCEGWGLRTPKYKTDFGDFHAIIWRNDHRGNDRPEIGQSHRPEIGQSHRSEIGQSHRPESVDDKPLDQKILFILMGVELSRKGIADALGISVQAGWFKKTLNRLLEDNLVERTISDPARRNSRLQKYRLTEKAREILINRYV